MTMCHALMIEKIVVFMNDGESKYAESGKLICILFSNVQMENAVTKAAITECQLSLNTK